MAKVIIVKLYEFSTTEHNGEQEYTQSHLIQARNIKDAIKLIIEYCKKWYDTEEDNEVEISEYNGTMKFSFFNDEITLYLGDITETSIADWQEKMLRQALVN